MQEESAEEQVVIMYHLLQSEEGKQGPRNLEARDKVAIRTRDMWSTVSLFKARTGSRGVVGGVVNERAKMTANVFKVEKFTKW